MTRMKLTLTIDWKKTYRCRQNRLSQLQSAQEYFNQFPVLKLNDGYKLLLEDFSTRFQEKTQNKSIYTIWPPLVPIIVQLGKEKKVLLPELEWPEAKRDNEVNLILSLKVLSWLHLVTIRNHMQKRNFRPSKLESLESFLLHIQTIGELDTKIEERKSKALLNKIGLQPFMVCVGPINQVTFYVIVDSQKYVCENCLMALDLTLKIFFVLNLQYPPECKAVWQTVDQLLYKLENDIDSNASSVLSDIEKKLNKIE
ncbi:hypothetical protein RN001_005633 [Aquatica leii]|uniref:Uncharacterized protein n=1 Tax=Aquatica leii TaxID=1421715 RepID=A0AAN7SIZ4_9COLE|nr:hypothetical protein RN001_005633 [Aquatica leii]